MRAPTRPNWVRRSKRAGVVLIAGVMLATSACTTVLTDASGAPDSSVKLATQADINKKLPEKGFWGSNMKDTETFRSGWFSSCKNEDYPDPTASASVDPEAFTITGNGSGVDAQQLDVAVKVTVFDKRSAAKQFNQKAIDSAKACPPSEELGSGTSDVATITYVPSDFTHGKWKGELLLSKVSRAYSGEDPTKDVQVTAIASTGNISVMANLYGLKSTDQDSSLAKITALFKELLDVLDTSS